MKIIIVFFFEQSFQQDKILGSNSNEWNGNARHADEVMWDNKTLDVVLLVQVPGLRTCTYLKAGLINQQASKNELG